MKIPIRRVTWQPCYRIVPSRFPPINLFERVADPEDWEAIIAVESLTNDRIRDEAGQIQLVPPQDRISGPGASTIMAAFTHPNPEGSRFSDGSYGVFYAGRELDTAVAETKHHRVRFMRATRQPAMELDMRVYAVDLSGRLHDVRRIGEKVLTENPDLRFRRPRRLPGLTGSTSPSVLLGLHAPGSYSDSQYFAREKRTEGSEGIVYDSVRHKGGQCIAAFVPRILSNCRQERHLCYVWDGEKIATVYEKRSFD